MVRLRELNVEAAPKAATIPAAAKKPVNKVKSYEQIHRHLLLFPNLVHY